MNFFFRRKTQHVLRTEQVPLTDAFRMELRAKLIAQEELVSPSMKRNSFANRLLIGSALLATGMATTVIAWQYGPNQNHLPTNSTASASDVVMTVNDATYHEFTFVHKDTEDSSREALPEIAQDNPTFFEEAQEISTFDFGHYYDIRGEQQLKFQNHEYHFVAVHADTEEYAFVSDGKTLFTRIMCAPAELAEDGRSITSVNNLPAVRFMECEGGLEEGNNHNLTPYQSDIYYNGEFIDETYGVKNTQLVFSWKGKTGFIADLNGKSYLFYDGKPVSGGFDSIHVENCCAVREVEPSLYDNGTFMIFGTRGTESIIAEVKLEE